MHTLMEMNNIVNDSDDFLDDFLPQNYIVDGIQKLRNTELYQKTNEYGKSVIELCTEAQLRILNGRTIGDSVGRITYYNYIGASIDDYCICNSSFLQNIVSFNVGDFEPTLSDHQASTLTYFSTCPFGQLTKKSTCPTQSFSCSKKIIKITNTRE